jgi:predicted phage terminase large subunit-like protein
MENDAHVDFNALTKKVADYRALLSADRGKKNLMPFIEATYPNYKPAKHHELIAEKLEAVERGDIKRLMIFMPPQHGKSQIASIHFPAWYIGRNPDKRIITASYSGRLADDFGRQARNLVQDEEYRAIFPEIALSADSQAANRWHIDNHRGYYMSVGVQGATTGRGADLFLIDDPVRDASEADSEVMRDRVWDWFATVAYTRLGKDAPIVIIQTRWHEDDLSGRLLDDMAKGGQQWEVISLPAIAEQHDPIGRQMGDALWPERYDEGVLAETRRIFSAQAGNRYWQAMYQQRPTPEEGDFFLAKWINRYESRPDTKEMTIYATSDYAVTEKGGDYTVHMIFGITQDNDIYVLDCYREQASTEEWIEVQLAMMKEWRPLEWVGERGQIESSIGPFLRKMMDERNVYCNINSLPSMASKAQRAQSIRGRAAMGKLYFPKHAKWADDVVDEMMHFPHGKNDDTIDCLSLMGRILDTTYSPSLRVVSQRNRDIHYGTNIIDAAREADMSAVTGA